MEGSGPDEDSCYDLTNRTCFKFSLHNFRTIIWIKTTLAVLATVACSLTIVLIIFFKAYKKFIQRLAFYLSTAALANAIIPALEFAPVENRCGHVVVRDEVFCEAIGFLHEYAAWVMHNTVVWITLHLFMLAVFKRNYKSWKYEAGGVTVCLLFGLPFSIVPFVPFTGDTLYGLSGIWCWIKIVDQDCTQLKEGVIEQFSLFYGPFLLFVNINFLAMLAIVIILFYRGRKRESNYENMNQQYRKALKESLPLLFYPIIFNTFFFLAFANRIYYAVTSSISRFSLWILHAIAIETLPLLISLAFLLHPQTLKKFKRKQLQRMAKKWVQHPRARSLRSQTHFIVSKEWDISETSTQQKQLVLMGRHSEQASAGYQSFLEFQTPQD